MQWTKQMSSEIGAQCHCHLLPTCKNFLTPSLSTRVNHSHDTGCNGTAFQRELVARRLMGRSHVLSCSVLLLVRVSIAAICGSLSIIVTTLDAVLDVISGFIIWSTSIAKRRKNKYKFPIGQVLPEGFTCLTLALSRVGTVPHQNGHGTVIKGVTAWV